MYFHFPLKNDDGGSIGSSLLSSSVIIYGDLSLFPVPLLLWVYIIGMLVTGAMEVLTVSVSVALSLFNSGGPNYASTS